MPNVPRIPPALLSRLHTHAGTVKPATVVVPAQPATAATTVVVRPNAVAVAHPAVAGVGARPHAVAAAQPAVGVVARAGATVVRPNPVHAGAGVVRHIAINPVIRERLLAGRDAAAGGGAAPGLARDQVTAPISPVPVLTDSVLFEDPVDAAKKSYLPRYRVRSQGSRYDVSVTTAPDGNTRVVLGLERFPAPELGHAAQGAAELPHQTEVFVHYLAGPTHAIAKTLALTESTPDDRGLTVAATLGLSERDALLFALKTPAAALRIVARRTVRVALPIVLDGAPAAAPAKLRSPRASAVARATSPAAAAVQPTLAHMAMLSAMGSLGGIRVTGPVSNEPAPSTPAPPRFEVVDRALDDGADPEPFLLDPQLHAYAYAGVGGPTATPAEAYRRIVIQHPKGSPQARFHTYLQDTSEPSTFHYLPDAFKLARGDSAPFLPEMVVRIGTPDASVEKATVTVDYVLEPWSDEARLAAATAALDAEIPASSREQPLELRPLQAKASMHLWVPTAGAPVLAEQADVTIDLANGFRHSLTLPIDGFRQLYAAAFSRDATSLFSGQVRVETGLSSPEAIPLEVRFADTRGELVVLTETPSDAEGGVIAVRMQNAIESPLRLRALPVRVRRGEAEVAGVVEGLVFDPPLELAAQSEVAFTVRLVEPLPGEGVLDADFDLSGVEVLPLPDVILPLISDTSVPAEYERDVEVMTMPELLGDPADPTSILIVNVELKGSTNIRLTRDQTSGVVAVRLPITDLLLGRDTKGTYAFRQQVIRKNGTQTADADWRQADFGVLVVPMV